MNKKISVLLGAGFSAPMGYPIGNQLNDLLIKSIDDNFAFAPSGDLAISIDGSKPDFGYRTSYDIEFEFCHKLILHFEKKKGYFDYEEFYDYIVDEIENDKNIEDIAKPFLSDTTSLNSLKSGLKNVYTQVVAHYLKDRDGNSYYDNLPFIIDDNFHGYTGIMKSIKELSINSILNIHTLNHDLFFERFNNTSFLEGKLSNGFEELGSPYFGKLTVKDRKYMVRLQRYTGKYFGNLRLYKLHGSLDYQLYYRNEKGQLFPETYVKSRYGIGSTDLYKEIKNKISVLEYENCWINYHPDFLTGTTSKIQRYTEPLLFKKLFQLFKENLKNADKLIIIGYGAKDDEVNNIILEHFDFKNKKTFIVDPYAGDNVKEFGEKINAKLITKQLENINIKDFE
jgi:NAD-dependent SIR2 family protein deacetylase